MLRRHWPWIVVLVLLGLAGSVPARASGIGAPIVYNSGNGSELVTSLIITHAPGPYQRTVIYCVDLGAPPLGGEILYVSGDEEFTNPYTYNVALSAHLLLTTSCAATDGGEISEDAGFNITPDMHHGAISRSGSLVVAVGNSRQYVAFIADAASTAAPTCNCARLAVEPDYGRLSVLRWP